ncbi:BatA domain-containing protein [Stieleria sp. ICT_E10.1]|uniref:BatA domain-containing protein n=1 Tax=Stieleria sedimenti TaxID=2976331 RepID=UPI00217F3A1F|nr:BatA domain-containing protein [Stieleria sedimenti]MCS7469385.1 BatA domain-containing protein [Stieleria sedimenti]
MSLLNAALAFGAFAFTIPLIIHLFFRSRFKTVDWGAMYLLESVVRVNRRRMQVTNLLLLLLRCAIPVLLAFCLARPVWTGLRALAGDAPKTLVIAIDDSRSMSLTPPGEPARIEVAKEELRTVLADLTRRDEVMLVRGSRLGAVPSKMGVSDALAALRKIDAQGNAVSIGQLVDAAIAAADEGSHPRRQILVVSDFQAGAVDAATLEAARRIAETNQIEAESDRGNQMVIDMLDVGTHWDDLANVSVDAVTIDSPVIVSERSGVYTATLRNASDLPANDLRLIWSIDGKPLEPRVVSIDAKSTSTNRLTHTIDQAGIHEIAATIDRGDVLVDDNTRSVAVEVINEVNVLLVDGRPGNEPLSGQADFLAIALSPFAFGGDDRPDPVRAAVVTSQRLESALDENPTRVIVLCGVGQLSDSAKQRIAIFVDQGGALVVFDGPSLRPELYNQGWRNQDAVLSFPASLGDVVGNPDVDSGGSEETFAIDQPTSLYQPWKILARGSDNPLSAVNLSAYRAFTIDEADENAPTHRIVLLRTTDGAPLAVMDTVGDGTVVQFAISGNAAWTNLPLRPVFLPLIQQMVLDLAGKRSDAMIQVGQPIVISPNDWPAPQTERGAETRTHFAARTPRGQFELETPDAGEPVRLTATYSPGVYTIQKRLTDLADPEKSETMETLRIATVDASESMLVDVSQERQQTLANILSAQVFESAVLLQDADRSRSFGREIWRVILVALLIALVAELWLQQNLVARRRITGGTS